MIFPSLWTRKPYFKQTPEVLRYQHYLPYLSLKTKNPDLKGASVEMWGTADPFISRSAACSLTHSASGTYVPLPLRPGCWGDHKELRMCCREKAQGVTSFVLVRAYVPFRALQGNNFYTFIIHECTICTFRWWKVSLLWMTKEYIALYNFCPAEKALAKLQEKGESEILLRSSIYQKAVCICVCTWNELMHMNPEVL